jgi:flavodoxin
VKTLVVYYSFENNTRFIAETIAEAIQADLLELKPLQDLKTHGFMKFIWGGKQVFLRQKPDLAEFKHNPLDYDLLFLGTPVWAFNYAPAMRTFLSKVQLKNKKIALFCCFSENGGKTLAKMRAELRGNEIIGEKGFAEPIIGNPEKAAEAKEWAAEISAKSRFGQP